MNRGASINQIKLLKAQRKRKVKESFYLFFKFFWSTIVPDALEEAPYHKYLCNELEKVGRLVIERKPKEYDLVINVPPGSSKSTIISQMFPVWLWINDSSIRTISSSYSSELSMEQSERSRDLIRSDLFKSIFPAIQLKFDTTGKKNYKTNNGGQRYSTSTGGTVTGVHGHVIIIDEPVTPQDAESEVKRATANDFITKTLSSRKVDKKITLTIMIMQRLHQDDPTGVVLNKWKKVKHIKLPAEQRAGVIPLEAEQLYTDGLLDGNRMGLDVLADNKKVLGSYGYAGQFDQNPAPNEGGMFKKAWFKKITRVEFENMNAESIENYAPEWNFASDTAYTKQAKNDPSGILCYCVMNNNLFIRRYQDEYLEFPELVKWLESFSVEFGYGASSRIYVEPKASGKSAVQYLTRYSSLNIIEDKSPTADKVSRARGTTAIAEAGRVFLLTDYDGVGQTEWIESFLLQMAVFPNGIHDETVDCFGIAVRRLELGAGRVIAF